MREFANDEWKALVKQAAEIGAKHGKNKAEWWLQHTLGGSASGDVKKAAKKILDEIEDCDADLPGDGMSGEFAGEYGMPQLYAELGIDEEDDTDDLSLVTTYQNAFSTAIEAEVSRYANEILEG